MNIIQKLKAIKYPQPYTLFHQLDIFQGQIFPLSSESSNISLSLYLSRIPTQNMF